MLDGSDTVKRFHLNRKPGAPATVTIGSKNPTDGENLTARPAAAVDPDGDALSYQYRWYSASAAGGPWTLCSRRTKVLPASYTTAGQYWKVGVRAYDGALYGGWRYSSATRVVAGAPAAACSAEAGGQGATISVRAVPGARVEATVANLAGRPVASLAAVVAADGCATLRWSGRSARGSQAPRGVYLVRACVRCADGAVWQAVTPLRLP